VSGMGDSAPRIDTRALPGCPVGIVTDPQRLGQILTNLVGNALKFSPAGEHVGLEAGPGTEDQIVFNVRDHGPGIPDSEHSKIFERFAQADSEATRNTHGVGLGLYITRELATAMGGTVSLISAPGAGSTFLVTIPVAGPAAPREPAPLSEAVRSG
ncbi:MAG: ATP-binding protein, partial [Actinomycetota bacterium]